MRCDQCKHWIARDGEPFELGDFGLCRATRHNIEIGEWAETQDGYQWVAKPEYAAASAAVQDGSGYYAALLTHPGHFCAMYEADE